MKENLKYLYNFDFLTLAKGYKKKKLEDTLTINITKFLFELGKVLFLLESKYLLWLV